LGRPFCRIFSTVPLGVPSGTCSASSPSSVGTCTDPPRASVVNGTRSSQCKVVVVPLEERDGRRRAPRCRDRRAARPGRRARLTGQAQALAGGDAGGIFTFRSRCSVVRPLPRHGLARLGDDAAGAAAVAARSWRR
jgi:hypothetical protein